MKSCDPNMDAVFKLADEVLPSTSSSCLVRAVAPEKLGLDSETSSLTCDNILGETQETAEPDRPFEAEKEAVLDDTLLLLPDQIRDYSICEVIFF